MSNRPVTFDDMIAFFDWVERPQAPFMTCVSILEKRQWWRNQLADGAGTTKESTTSPATSASGAAASGASATATPPSAGTTVSGAGSLIAAVEALRVALADNMGVYLAAKNLLALDVPGMLKAEHERAASLADSMLYEKRRADAADTELRIVRSLLDEMGPKINQIRDAFDRERAEADGLTQVRIYVNNGHYYHAERVLKKHGGAA